MKLQLYRYILLMFVLWGNLSFGQLVLLDSQDDMPIVFANIISKKGNLVATSDIHGVININDISNNQDNLVIQHVSYNNKTVSPKDLKTKKTILLERKEIRLPEVILKSEKRDIVMLKGYYRSYKLSDNILKYYTDGIIEYYISIKKQKNLRTRILKSRSYRNIALIEQERQQSFNVKMGAATVPNIDYRNIPKAFAKRKYTIDKSSENDRIKKDDTIVGVIKANKALNRMELNMDFIAPEKDKTRSLFGYTSKITNIEVTENYEVKELSELSLKHLLSRKEYIKLFFKHKKDDRFARVDNFAEFYVFDKRYLSKDEYKKVSASEDIPQQTNSEDRYWETLDQYNIPAINDNIENAIQTILEKYEAE